MHLQLVTHGLIPVEGLVIRQMAGDAARQPINVTNTNVNLSIQPDQLDWLLVHWWMNGGNVFTQTKVTKNWNALPQFWVIPLASEFRHWLSLPSTDESMANIDKEYRSLLRHIISEIKNPHAFFHKHFFDPASYFEEVLAENTELKEVEP